MERKIREAEKRAGVKRDAGQSKKGMLVVTDRRGKKHELGGQVRYANIGFSRVFGPSARETFIRCFISVMRMNADGPEVYRVTVT